jgi:uncharacterized protein (TIGR02466 family)
MIQIHDLFPIPLGIVKKPECFTEEERDYILGLAKIPNQGNITSEDNYILNSTELQSLRIHCDTMVKDFFKLIYQPRNAVDIYITQSWANFTNKGQYHHRHAHPNSFLSGVLYIDVDEDLDKIHFYRNQYRQLDVPTDNYNQWNSETWYINAEKYQLLMFPSSTEHMVHYVESDKKRISISFNTFLRGALGENMRLSEVHLA